MRGCLQYACPGRFCGGQFASPNCLTTITANCSGECAACVCACVRVCVRACVRPSEPRIADERATVQPTTTCLLESVRTRTGELRMRTPPSTAEANVDALCSLAGRSGLPTRAREVAAQLQLARRRRSGLACHLCVRLLMIRLLRVHLRRRCQHVPVQGALWAR